MNVDREEYGSQRIIMCPLPACRHSWCKECLKPLASPQTEHKCKQQKFERLMRKKGWKYCPGMSRLIIFSCRPPQFLGCKTPIQKETGCNHMTVGSFFIFYLNYILNLSSFFFRVSAGLLDVMCKSFYFSKVRVEDALIHTPYQNHQTFLLQVWNLDHRYFQWRRCWGRSNKALYRLCAV